MKLHVIKSVLLCVSLFLELKFTNSEPFSEEKYRPHYDVSRTLAEALNNIQTIQNMDILTNNLNREVLNHLQNLLVDPINIVTAFTNLSDKCVQDLNYVGEHLTFQDLKQRSWAVRMIDAVAKPESGILIGNTKWLGDYDECVGVYAPKKSNSSAGGFHGKYCKLGRGETYPITTAIGFCIPETCNLPNKMELDLSFLNTTLGLDKYNISVTCQPLKKKLTGGAIATIFIMSVFTFLVIVGSSLTVIKHFSTTKRRRNSFNSSANGKTGAINHDEENSIQETSEDQDHITEGSKTLLDNFIEKVDPFFNCFCIFTNGSKLLNTDATEGQLLCLHGIRFFSMSWVIICHVYLSFLEAIKSFSGLLNKIDNFSFQVILNGFFSVDSFFVLSGFLMSYLYFQEASKNKGKTPWLYFYVHRYLRLTPVYMIVLAFYTTIAPYMSSGPLSPIYDTHPSCQKNWWRNLLYINNFQSSSEQCMGWSWYLANDMQFFAISPLFLITLWRWPKIGYSILALFLFGVWVASFCIAYHYNLVAGGFGNVVQITKDPTFIPRWQDTFNKIYTKPYTRMAPYLVGIALGHFMFIKKVANYKPDFKTLFIGWSLAIPVGLTCIYGLYHHNPGLVASCFYNALSRTCFALCVSWVIFTCLNGEGGAVDKILSFKLFIPLSRLTYCAYLIHLIIVMYYAETIKTTFDFSHTTMVILFLGFMLITYAISLLVSLIFESPLIRLEKFIRNKFKS